VRFISVSVYLLFFSLKIPLNRAAKVQRISFAPTLFLKKLKKAKPNLISPFSNG
jgi:hypothetical protein